MSDAGPPVDNTGEPNDWAATTEPADVSYAAGETVEGQAHAGDEPAEGAVEGEPVSQPVVRRKPGMLEDPVVRVMAFAAIGIVILFLMVALGVALSGIATPTGPRTLSEKELALAGAAVRKGNADAATYGTYIAALIDNNRLSQAESVLRDAKASVDDSRTMEFAVAQVRLDMAREQYKKAIPVADDAQKKIAKKYQDVIDAGGPAAFTAKHNGMPETWFVLALLKAKAYVKLKDWKKAIAEYDSYIAVEPRAADILIDRGNAKVEAGDKEGAEADFREALKYIPDDAEALKGLEKIGASNK